MENCEGWSYIVIFWLERIAKLQFVKINPNFKMLLSYLSLFKSELISTFQHGIEDGIFNLFHCMLIQFPNKTLDAKQNPTTAWKFLQHVIRIFGRLCNIIFFNAIFFFTLKIWPTWGFSACHQIGIQNVK